MSYLLVRCWSTHSAAGWLMAGISNTNEQKKLKRHFQRWGGGRFWISLANDRQLAAWISLANDRLLAAWISVANDGQLAAWILIFSLHLINDCNRNCTCDNLKYMPVCSETNGMTYYSACHAGCSQVFNDSKVRLRLGIMRLTATEGLYSLWSLIMHYK